MPLVLPIWVLLAAMLLVAGVAAGSAIVRLRERRAIRAVLAPAGFTRAGTPPWLAGACRPHLPHGSASGVRAGEVWTHGGRLVARLDYVLGGASRRRNATRVVAASFEEPLLFEVRVSEPSPTLAAAYERLALGLATPAAAEDVAA